MRFGAGALLIHGRGVLLGRRGATESEPLTWTVFGGMAEPGEDALGCMAREVFEEGRIRVSRSAARHIYLSYGYNRFEFHTYAVFLDRPEIPVLGEEMTDAGWFPLGSRPETLWEALPAPLHDGLAELVADRRVARTLDSWVSEANYREGRPDLGSGSRTVY